MQKQNPIIGGLVSGLVGGIPDLIAGIRETRAAKKAEKLKAAGLQQIVGGATLASVVENPEVLSGLINSASGGELAIPAEVLQLPEGFQYAYAALLIAGFIIRMVGNAYAKKAAKEQL
jgi:hypothetical protein